MLSLLFVVVAPVLLSSAASLLLSLPDIDVREKVSFNFNFVGTKISLMKPEQMNQSGTEAPSCPSCCREVKER